MKDETNEPGRNARSTADDQVMAAAREWLEETAPGVKRVSALPIPSLPRAREQRIRSWPFVGQSTVRLAMRAFAVAAVFAFGYLAGSRHSVEAQQPNSASGGMESNAGGPGAPAPAITPSPKASTITAKAEAPAPEAAAEPQRFARESDGRVLIDTTLRGNGAHVTWIVDGTFQIAQSNTSDRNRGN